MLVSLQTSRHHAPPIFHKQTGILRPQFSERLGQTNAALLGKLAALLHEFRVEILCLLRHGQFNATATSAATKGGPSKCTFDENGATVLRIKVGIGMQRLNQGCSHVDSFRFDWVASICSDCGLCLRYYLLRASGNAPDGYTARLGHYRRVPGECGSYHQAAQILRHSHKLK